MLVSPKPPNKAPGPSPPPSPAMLPPAPNRLPESWNKVHIDGFVQKRRNSSALAMELRLSCTNPLIHHRHQLTHIFMNENCNRISLKNINSEMILFSMEYYSTWILLRGDPCFLWFGANYVNAQYNCCPSPLRHRAISSDGILLSICEYQWWLNLTTYIDG